MDADAAVAQTGYAGSELASALAEPRSESQPEQLWVALSQKSPPQSVLVFKQPTHVFDSISHWLPSVQSLGCWQATHVPACIPAATQRAHTVRPFMLMQSVLAVQARHI